MHRGVSQSASNRPNGLKRRILFLWRLHAEDHLNIRHDSSVCDARWQRDARLLEKLACEPLKTVCRRSLKPGGPKPNPSNYVLSLQPEKLNHRPGPTGPGPRMCNMMIESLSVSHVLRHILSGNLSRGQRRLVSRFALNPRTQQ